MVAGNLNGKKQNIEYEIYKGHNEKYRKTCEMNLFSSHFSFNTLYGEFAPLHHSNEDTFYVTFSANGRNLVVSRSGTDMAVRSFA